MGLRPSSARWFEIVVPREDAHDTVEALARNGRVQFEWLGARAASSEPQRLQEPLAHYRALARDYARFWPTPVFERRCCTLPVEMSAKVALHQLTHWRDAAGDLLAQLDAAERERALIGDWVPVLQALSGFHLDLGALASAGPALAPYCLVLPAQAAAPDPGLHLGLRAALKDGRVLLGVLPPPALERLCREASTAGGRCLAIPEWLEGAPAACLAALSARLARLDERIAHLDGQLRGLALEHGVDRATGVLERLDWFQTTAQSIDCDSQYCWVTGWTSEATPGVMNDVLRDMGVRASVAFVEPPVDAASPSVTDNPAWLRPFEVFTHAMGIPGPTEADPTPWVAALVCLLFGYMCGDVGHGALIVAAGLWLRRRNPLWPLLVACGVAAGGFGLVFGHVFGFDGLLPPLWLSPLEDPMTLLVTPVVGGAVILTVGVVLHAVQSCWRGQGAAQWVADLAQLLVFWGLPLALWRADLGWLVVAGVALCMANRIWWGRSLMSLAEGLGTLAESTFTLILNTLSFARVGAFALAHAALESAVIGVAGAVDDPLGSAAIVVLGNLAVVVVEGVVVMIQTTRLILFEFFVRFFEGTGRAFRPVPSPSSAPARASARTSAQASDLGSGRGQGRRGPDGQA
jgi:V/A-type H+-transporting ATPase subunit I